MSTNVRVHPTLPVVIRTYTPDFVFEQQNETASLEDIALLDAQPHKVYYIVDIPDLTVNVENMMIWAKMMSQSDISQRKYNHPNVIENLMVVTQRMLEMAAQNLSRPSIAGVKLKTFRSLQEALNYIQEQQSVSH